MAKLKEMADLKLMTLDESDALIRSFHLELQDGHYGVHHRRSVLIPAVGAGDCNLNYGMAAQSQ
ncbi:unnamed protein product [Clonostachys solani]|uniref:Uncharacterized protein n=1 Tax=Clonostachys solani TaxID=160281 RepID=A0A9N9VZ62_9HYPO|nr:unnamed protein product [Clonostachys solani]